ncbi:MAG TPA: hypothetical protein VLE89_08355 [Chlamydiales bacterium]|nr:hypothetical protein [Chlamydiales bacterium]
MIRTEPVSSSPRSYQAELLAFPEYSKEEIADFLWDKNIGTYCSYTDGEDRCWITYVDRDGKVKHQEFICNSGTYELVAESGNKTFDSWHALLKFNSSEWNTLVSEDEIDEWKLKQEIRDPLYFCEEPNAFERFNNEKPPGVYCVYPDSKGPSVYRLYYFKGERLAGISFVQDKTVIRVGDCVYRKFSELAAIYARTPYWKWEVEKTGGILFNRDNPSPVPPSPPFEEVASNQLKQSLIEEIEDPRWFDPHPTTLGKRLLDSADMTFAITKDKKNEYTLHYFFAEKKQICPLRFQVIDNESTLLFPHDKNGIIFNMDGMRMWYKLGDPLFGEDLPQITS